MQGLKVETAWKNSAQINYRYPGALQPLRHALPDPSD